MPDTSSSHSASASPSFTPFDLEAKNLHDHSPSPKRHEKSTHSHYKQENDNNQQLKQTNPPQKRKLNDFKEFISVILLSIIYLVINPCEW